MSIAVADPIVGQLVRIDAEFFPHPPVYRMGVLSYWAPTGEPDPSNIECVVVRAAVPADNPEVDDEDVFEGCYLVQTVRGEHPLVIALDHFYHELPWAEEAV